MQIRLAASKDIDQLVRMRWDFTLEYNPDILAVYTDFHAECSVFLKEAMDSGKWFIWVADLNGRVVSHIYIELIYKVPRPGRITQPFAYMTNVYTLPEYRAQGIGSSIMQAIEAWGREKQLEFIMVWTSNESIPFYGRNGYTYCTEPMELKLEDGG
jgi:GNAT superfamily N-acetyltransferase